MDQLRRIFIGSLLLVVLAGCASANQEVTATVVPPTLEATATAVPSAAATAVPVLEESGPLVPDGVVRELYYAPYPLNITLDGEAGDWDRVPRVALPVDGEPQMTFAAAADDTFLYLLAEVSDENIISGAHADSFWNEDSVEFYVNASGDLALKDYRPGVAQITIPPLNIGGDPAAPVLGGMLNSLEGVQAMVVPTADGYRVEAAVPLQSNVWDIDPAHGNIIGFQVHLNSAATSSRDGKLIWSAADTADVSYLHPNVFGELVFYEIGRAEVVVNVPPTATPLPTRVPLEENPLYLQADAPIDERVEDLLARMTLQEKIGQMTLIEKDSLKDTADIAAYALGGLLSGGGGSPPDNSAEGWAAMVDGYQEIALGTHLGIPLIYGVDAVHGHGNLRGATIFPHNIGLGAANNPQLMSEIGRITAAEMIATGIYWNYAPTVAVPQDVRWGRTYEGYSEDTAVVTALGPAYLRGLQGEDIGAADTVLGTAKHFVGDGGTAFGSSTTDDYLIDQGDMQVDEATLRAVHLPPYPALIEGGVDSVMISFSSWNGTKMHANPYLITDVLKGELGFEGFVVSDWAGIAQIDPDYATAVITAINAGIDMNMEPYDYELFGRTLLAAVENGDISPERIDDAVRRILAVKMEMGLFERPFSDPAQIAAVGSADHRAVARQAVAESLVLLKNEGSLPLPLSPDLPAIYVAGPAADDIGIQSGGWTIAWQGAEGEITPGTTILEGIREAVGADTAVYHSNLGRFDELPSAGPMVCVGVAGERPYAEGQGDSVALRLPPTDMQMLVRMREQCDQLIVVLLSGRPVIISDEISQWDSVVAAWLPGTEGGGVADGLFGVRPFTGRLPYTWPRSVEQLPFDFATLVEGEALFPRGFGLGGG